MCLITPGSIGLHGKWNTGPAQLSTLHIISSVLADRAAAPVLALASDKMADDRGEETVKSNVAGFPLSQLPTKTSAGRELSNVSPDLFRHESSLPSNSVRMSNKQETCVCEKCSEEIPIRSKFCPECGAQRNKKQRVDPEELPKPAQGGSDGQVTLEPSGSGATPGAPSVTPSDQDKDGSLNLRKRRSAEEGGGTEPAVKVRRKGSGASEGSEQVCGELNDFNQQSSSVPRVQSSTVPRVQSSSVPRVQSSSVPCVQSSSVPCVQSSTVPRVQSSSVPRVQSSTVLPVQSSLVPPVQSSQFHLSSPLQFPLSIPLQFYLSSPLQFHLSSPLSSAYAVLFNFSLSTTT
ncbi:hypothetical protein EMCRGX_G020538 [Ephydatia muelleri]